MILLSKTVPRLNNDHKIPLPPTLGEAIFQGDHLFRSTRYGVPANQCFVSFFLSLRSQTLLQVQILAIMHIMKPNQL